uniref:Uncharacterized protein n=1 Tax=Anguilla anguilla TaxID=7936 RepID=A0A0E9Q5M2_ANGAN
MQGEWCFDINLPVKHENLTCFSLSTHSPHSTGLLTMVVSTVMEGK